MATFMHASKAILNLPTSSLHLCSPLQQNRKVKIHHQFTSFPKQLGQDSPPRKQSWVKIHQADSLTLGQDSLSNKQNNKRKKRAFVQDSPVSKFY